MADITTRNNQGSLIWYNIQPKEDTNMFLTNTNVDSGEATIATASTTGDDPQSWVVGGSLTKLQIYSECTPAGSSNKVNTFLTGALEGVPTCAQADQGQLIRWVLTDAGSDVIIEIQDVNATVIGALEYSAGDQSVKVKPKTGGNSQKWVFKQSAKLVIGG